MTINKSKRDTKRQEHAYMEIIVKPERTHIYKSNGHKSNAKEKETKTNINDNRHKFYKAAKVLDLFLSS